MAVAWKGLPFYGAACLGEAIRVSKASIAVVATRPSVPVTDIEARVGQAIVWIEGDAPCSWDALNLPVPDVFFETGWATPAFNALAREAKGKGAAVVSFVDNAWKGDFRQWLGAARFRMGMRRRFDALWVPGRSGRRFARFLGMPDRAIHEGLYGCDRSVFDNGVPLAGRPRRFLYVGQFIERKGLRELCEAFAEIHREEPEWELVCIGCGPLKNELEETDGVRVLPFMPPEQVAEHMADARFFVLNSREEHWGVVVHEAATAGCGLILAPGVDSRRDLATEGNAIVAASSRALDARRALEEAARKDDAWLERAEAISRRLAESFGPDRWAREFERILEEVRPEGATTP